MIETQNVEWSNKAFSSASERKPNSAQYESAIVCCFSAMGVLEGLLNIAAEVDV